LDIEIFKFSALEQAAKETDLPFNREHVTPYLREPGRFNVATFLHDSNLSKMRWTVDEAVDFEVISKIFAHFAPDIHFGWQQVLNLETSHPQIFSVNQQILRNEGAVMGTGQKLWKRAKHVNPREQKCFCPSSGQPISVRPRAAQFGT
jgi:glutamate-1-semialdehyde 2,1-aminomutase